MIKPARKAGLYVSAACGANYRPRSPHYTCLAEAAPDPCLTLTFPCMISLTVRATFPAPSEPFCCCCCCCSKTAVAGETTSGDPVAAAAAALAAPVADAVGIADEGCFSRVVAMLRFAKRVGWLVGSRYVV